MKEYFIARLTLNCDSKRMLVVKFELIFPVATLVLGWFLNSLLPVIQDWRDKRKAVKKALADLLEIRHTLLTRQMAMEEIKKWVPPSVNIDRQLSSFLQTVLPSVNDLSNRFNQSVTEIASTDALLGFQLRSKDIAAKIAPIFSDIEVQIGRPVQEFSEIETQLINLLIPHLDKTILDLAKQGGWRTYLILQRYVKQRITKPNEIDGLLSALKAKVEADQMKTAEV